jgi:alpha-tubulin suppressor-like RCC1 family protein
MIPKELKSSPVDITSLGTFTHYVVQKIVFGLEHCVVKFQNVKNEIGVFGCNKNGQLGLDIKPVKDDPLVNFYSKFVLYKLSIQDTSDFEILDIAANEQYTLILVNFHKKEKHGSANYIFRFGQEEKDNLLIDGKIDKNIRAIKKEEFKYDDKNLIKQIYTHENKDVFLTQDNSIYIKGSSYTLEILEKYKMVVEKFEKKISYLSLGKNHLLIFTEDKNLYSLGDNEYGELGVEKLKYSSQPVKVDFFEKKEEKIKKVCAGGRHSLVLTENFKVYAFGDNSEGQCTGFDPAYFNPIKIKFPGKPKIIDIHSSYNHSIALTTSGEVFSWGDTSEGKLGYVTGVSTQKIPKSIPFLNSKNISKLFCGPMQTAILTSTFENSLVSNYTTIDHI